MIVKSTDLQAYQFNVELKNQYNSLLNKAQLYIDGSKIEQYAPKISAKDYQLGVIKRYFIQKANDKNSPIFEISKRTAPKYRENPLYNLFDSSCSILSSIVRIGFNFSGLSILGSDCKRTVK